MCGVTANNQEDNQQVNDLQLKDNKRTALVSTSRGWHSIDQGLKMKCPKIATRNRAVIRGYLLISFALLFDGSARLSGCDIKKLIASLLKRCELAEKMFC